MTSSLHLNDAQIKIIKDNKDVFVRAERATNVPWQAIAAIWYRESTLQKFVDRVGGPFQFDPPPAKERVKKLLDLFTDFDELTKSKMITKGVNDFETGAIIAACWMRFQSKFVLSKDKSDEAVKDALYGYNGRKFESADHSFYVMNGYDAAHMNMRIHGTLPDKHHPGKRITVDSIDKRPGAFCVYKQLKELNI
jgi:hypothetical protein